MSISFPNTFLYSISWEDSDADKPVLDIQPTDVVLTITGGGDNVFNLLLDGAKDVYCVDLNPSQYHLMELKAQTIKHSSYSTLWNMFGNGIFTGNFIHYVENFLTNLPNDTVQFWKEKHFYFRHGLYYYGSMGKIVSLIRVLQLKRVLCNPYLDKTGVMFQFFLFMYKMFVHMFCFLFGNTTVMWYMFGTPSNQIRMITEDDNRKLSEYVITSFENAIMKSDIVNNNHYYYLIFNGCFKKTNCPRYLEEQNFDFLKKNIDHLHNIHGEFVKVLNARMYDKIILMDHMDWMDEEYIDNLARVLHENMAIHGKAIFRSASLYPWYIDIFLMKNLVVTNITNHLENPYMDRVNTYGSFWVIEHS